MADPFLVWDVGTGSGAVAVALAVRAPPTAVRHGRPLPSLGRVAGRARGRARERGQPRRRGPDGLRGGRPLRQAAHPGGPSTCSSPTSRTCPTATVPDLPIAASFEPAHRARRRRRRTGARPAAPAARAAGGAGAREPPHSSRSAPTRATPVTAAVAEHLPGWACAIRADLAGAAPGRGRGAAGAVADGGRRRRPGRGRDATRLRQAIAALRAGSIVGIPTETVYGRRRAPRGGAAGRVIAAKGRAPEKGIAVLIDDLEPGRGPRRVPPEARRLADRFWPGALTLVLALRGGVRLPDALTGGSEPPRRPPARPPRPPRRWPARSGRSR